VVSPVFRHGKLRLYLLKLLDEAPRHGYEVIRLLQDRFLGVYSPSPGTIYPRLARLEEEGLVTRDETDGKKIYRITEKGRAEIRARVADLAELEEELAASVRDIAREVTQDVRQTVRGLREGGKAREAFRVPRGSPGGLQAERGQAGGGQLPDGTATAAQRQHAGLLGDLERVALEFAGDLRSAGGQAEGIGENAVVQLRGILADTLTRIRADIFRPAGAADARAAAAAAAAVTAGAPAAAGSAPAAPRGAGVTG